MLSVKAIGRSNQRNAPDAELEDKGDEEPPLHGATDVDCGDVRGKAGVCGPCFPVAVILSSKAGAVVRIESGLPEHEEDKCPQTSEDCKKQLQAGVVKSLARHGQSGGGY